VADLTTLARVKDALNIDQSDVVADDRLSSLISAISTRFEEDADRHFTVATYTDTVSGNGGTRVTLEEYPVISVTSVTVNDQVIPARPNTSSQGWVLRADAVELVGYVFAEGVANVVIVYSAGYSPVPADVEQAVMESVVASYKQAPFAAYQQASAGGEAVQLRPGYLWSPFAFSVIQDYRRPGLS
jgi:hypothetical protein